MALQSIYIRYKTAQAALSKWLFEDDNRHSVREYELAEDRLQDAPDNVRSLLDQVIEGRRAAAK